MNLGKPSEPLNPQKRMFYVMKTKVFENYSNRTSKKINNSERSKNRFCFWAPPKTQKQKQSLRPGRKRAGRMAIKVRASLTGCYNVAGRVRLVTGDNLATESVPT